MARVDTNHSCGEDSAGKKQFLTALKELKSSETATREAGFHKVDELLRGFDGYFE